MRLSEPDSARLAGSPPRAGSNIPNPANRSTETINTVIPITGVARIWMMLVA